MENINGFATVIPNTDIIIGTIPYSSFKLQRHPFSIRFLSQLFQSWSSPPILALSQQHLTSSKEVPPCPTKHSLRYWLSPDVPTGIQRIAHTWKSPRCSCPLSINQTGLWWTTRPWRNWMRCVVAAKRSRKNKGSADLLSEQIKQYKLRAQNYDDRKQYILQGTSQQRHPQLFRM